MQDTCPTPDVLIVATSGEYPDEWRRVEDHVGRCATCQAEIRTYAATTHAWSLHCDPDTPRRLRARERKFRRAMRRRDLPNGLVAATRQALASLPVALTIGTVLLTTVLTNPTGDSTFESTLDQAMRCETGRSPRERQLVRVQVHPLPNGSSAATSPEDAISAVRSSTDDLIDGWPELAGSRDRLIEAFNVLSPAVDTRRPLSARGYQSWRRTVPDRRDEWLPRGTHIVLRTTTVAGPLREATLVLDRRTSCVVAQTWIVNGIGRVEFEAIAR